MRLLQRGDFAAARVQRHQRHRPIRRSRGEDHPLTRRPQLTPPHLGVRQVETRESSSPRIDDADVPGCPAPRSCRQSSRRPGSRRQPGRTPTVGGQNPLPSPIRAGPPCYASGRGSTNHSRSETSEGRRPPTTGVEARIRPGPPATVCAGPSLPSESKAATWSVVPSHGMLGCSHESQASEFPSGLSRGAAQEVRPRIQDFLQRNPRVRQWPLWY